MITRWRRTSPQRAPFRKASHPMQLHNFEKASVCRLEVYIFFCMAETSRGRSSATAAAPYPSFPGCASP
eukprot:14341595-Heterocapsa_arctica.AAC.1